MAFTKDKRNAVKAGQLWEKQDTGIVIEIVARHKSPYWKTRRINRNKGNGAHTITTYDLVKYYRLL